MSDYVITYRVGDKPAEYVTHDEQTLIFRRKWRARVHANAFRGIARAYGWEALHDVQVIPFPGHND